MDLPPASTTLPPPPGEEDGIFDIEVPIDPEVEAMMKAFDAEFSPDAKTIEEFDAESGSAYTKIGRGLEQCRKLPIKAVWREFAPFFKYQWNDEFKNFAALFLAIWQRESLFSLPNKGVLVQPNCRGKAAVHFTALKGKNLKSDLARSRTLDRRLQKKFKRCNLRSADYGPMQWNNRWRLRRNHYRPDITRALLLTSKYRKSQLDRLSMAELNRLVRFNAKALFILGGISLKATADNPEKTIDDYNTNPKYRTAVKGRREEYLSVLTNDMTCNP